MARAKNTKARQKRNVRAIARLGPKKKVSVGLLLFVMLRRSVARRESLGRKGTEEHNTVAERKTFSLYHSLIKVSIKRNPKTFFKCTRMYPKQYFDLVKVLRPLIEPHQTNFRESISIGMSLSSAMLQHG